MDDKKRIEELKEIVRENITGDLEFNNKMKSYGSTYKDYKLNKQDIFQLVSNKFDENSKELAELWFLETTKNFAHVEDALRDINKTT